MAFFDYGAAAELFPGRHKTRTMGAVTYMRFAAATEAIRYAVEEIPATWSLSERLCRVHLCVSLLKQIEWGRYPRRSSAISHLQQWVFRGHRA
jgi:hypothetical protein